MKLSIKGGSALHDWKILADGKEIEGLTRISFDIDCDKVPILDIRLFMEKVDIEIDELKIIEHVITTKELEVKQVRNIWMIIYRGKNEDKEPMIFDDREARELAFRAFKLEKVKYDCILFKGVK